MTRPLLSNLFRTAAGFHRDREAGAAIIFALSALPTFGLLAFAVDYGIGLNAKYKLDAAADAASMVAINAAKSVISNSSSSGSSVTAAAITEGQRQGALAFAANAGAIGFGTVPTPTIQLTRVNQKLVATVTYATQTANQLATMIGFRQTKMQGTSVSTLTMPTYINYYIITDISQSMGVAASAADMTALYNRIIKYGNYDTAANKTAKIGCVFGCHVQQVSGTYKQPDTNENLAHNSKYGTAIKLRIDSAKDAIQAVLTDATTANAQSGLSLVQIGIYTMQEDPTQRSPVTSTSYIQKIVNPPNADFSTSSTLVTNKMNLGANTGAGIGDTGFSNSINDFVTNTLPTQGDGSTAATPLNYVFLITDGISDLPGSNCTSGHCTAAFDDTICIPLKNKATVGVIYTTYNPIYYKNDASQGFDGNYTNLVAGKVGAVPTNLQACASNSSYYFEASDGDTIKTAMQALFTPTLQAARLAQ